MLNAYCNTTIVPKVNGKLLVPSDDGTRTIGVVRKGVFHKSNFHSHKHLCYKHNAIGIDKKAFEDYVLSYAKHIECHDRDKNTTYAISTTDFELHSIEDDLGWGIQLFCPLRHWRVEGNGHRQLSLWGDEQWQ